MKVTRNVFTISDLTEWMNEKALIINRNYQRSRGLWPSNSRSYFVDTILNGFPFPKIIIRQTIDMKTRKSIREIIDGQQRMTTINDFINGKLTLSTVSDHYSGKKFADLDEILQSDFLSYEVSVDTIISSTEEEVLEIFRRVNSYTLPLNEPEKRHATWQGEFKWFIMDMIKRYSPLFESYEILRVRQLWRMEDADLLSELCQAIDTGIETRSKAKINNLYKKYDDSFENKDKIEDKLTKILEYIKVNLNYICAERVLRGYSFYSLFTALLYNKWGIQNVSSQDLGGLQPINRFCFDEDRAVQNVLELFNAVDADDDEGRFKDFVKANKKATGNKNSRLMRLKWLVAALQHDFSALIADMT
jgi:hypothetical protein